MHDLQLRGIDGEKLGWSLGIRLLHWLTVIALAVQLAIGFFLFGPGMATHVWMPIHISVGAGIFGIVIVRLAWRLFDHAPKRMASPAFRRLAALVHASLYTLIVAVLITGWMAFRPAPFMPPAKLLGFFAVPQAPSVPDFSVRDLATAHSILVWVFLSFVALHLAAAVVHGVILRDGIVEGMLWSRGDRRAPKPAGQ